MGDKKFDLKVEYQRFKWNAKRKLNESVIWIRQNPEVVVFVFPIVLAGVKGASKIGAKMLQRANMERAEQQLKTRCYDPSEGHYWWLKRELSNQEWLMVNNRHKNGESFGDIFSSMNVLK